MNFDSQSVSTWVMELPLRGEGCRSDAARHRPPATPLRCHMGAPLDVLSSRPAALPQQVNICKSCRPKHAHAWLSNTSTYHMALPSHVPGLTAAFKCCTAQQLCHQCVQSSCSVVGLSKAISTCARGLQTVDRAEIASQHPQLRAFDSAVVVNMLNIDACAQVSGGYCPACTFAVTAYLWRTVTNP